MTLQINTVSLQAELSGFSQNDESAIQSRLRHQLTRVLESLELLPDLNDSVSTDSDDDISIPLIEINFPDSLDIDVFDDQELFSWLYKEIYRQLNDVLHAYVENTATFSKSHLKAVDSIKEQSDTWEQITKAIELLRGSLVVVQSGQRTIQVEKLLPLLIQQLTDNAQRHKVVRFWLQNPVFRARLIRLISTQPAVFPEFVRLVFKESLPEAISLAYSHFYTSQGQRCWKKLVEATIHCALVSPK